MSKFAPISLLSDNCFELKFNYLAIKTTSSISTTTKAPTTLDLSAFETVNDTLPDGKSIIPILYGSYTFNGIKTLFQDSQHVLPLIV